MAYVALWQTNLETPALANDTIQSETQSMAAKNFLALALHYGIVLYINQGCCKKKWPKKNHPGFFKKAHLKNKKNHQKSYFYFFFEKIF